MFRKRLCKMLSKWNVVRWKITHSPRTGFRGLGSEICVRQRKSEPRGTHTSSLNPFPRFWRYTDPSECSVMRHIKMGETEKKDLTDDEPAQHSSGSLITRFGICNRCKEIRSLTPIGYGFEWDRDRWRVIWIRYWPGNSVRDVGDKIKDGAVSEERSPEKVAILECWD